MTCGVFEKCIAGDGSKDGYACNGYPCDAVRAEWQRQKDMEKTIAESYDQAARRGGRF